MRAQDGRQDLADDAADPVFERPLFIVSPPRSGSTLLFETLARIPGVFTIGDESHGLIEGVPALNVASRGFESNRLVAADARPDVAAVLRQRFGQCLRDRYGQRPAASRRVRMLEKTPKNSLRIPFLRAVFPEARFVFLHRDPRQAMASMIDGWRSGGFRTYAALPGWDGPWSFLLVPGWRDLAGLPLDALVGEQWARTVRILLDDLEALPADRWIASDYQRLVDDPAAEIRRLCDWAGLQGDHPAGRALPLSKYTLTPPDAQKWRRYERFIEAQVARHSAIVDRAAGIGARMRSG